MTKNHYLFCFLILLLFGAPAFVVASKSFSQSKKPLVSPVSENQNIANPKKPRETISYYIIGSQQFLEKARKLASNQNQTEEDKKEIMKYVEKALSLAEQAIDAYPEDGRGYAQKAQIYESLTFLPQAKNLAILNFEKAAKLENNSSYKMSLAKLYEQTGQYFKAASFYFDLHLKNPTDVQLLYNLAENLEKTGEFEKARNSYEKLLALLENDEKGKKLVYDKMKNLDMALQKAKAKHLTEPGALQPGTPTPRETPEIFGGSELPIKEASLPERVIIAGGKEEVKTEEGETKTNAEEGKGVLPKGSTEVRIYTSKLTKESYVYVLPTSNAENKVLSVKAKKACPDDRVRPCQGWFEVGIDKPIDKDIEFNWWIIN